MLRRVSAAPIARANIPRSLAQRSAVILPLGRIVAASRGAASFGQSVRSPPAASPPVAAEEPKAPSDATASAAAPAPDATAAREQPDVVVDGKKVEKPLWDNCDTVEDIIEEEKYGDGGDAQQNQVQPEHIVLALRALIYGTVLAFVGVGVVALIAMKLGGFRSVDEVLHHVSSKDRRRLEELKQQGVEVVHYSVDLTQPGTVPDQLTALWEDILKQSGVSAEIERATAEAEAAPATTASAEEKSRPIQ
jgi:hypothetical protein